MVCESYHETSGVSFERLWNWPSVRIFVGIWSTPDKFELRQLIRSLYLKQQQNLTGDNVDFKFVLGTSSKYTPELKSRLTTEHNTYGDLIILEHMKNTNNAKAFYYWKWVEEHFNSTQYDYVAKTDDDTFVHFQNLALNLRPLSRNRLYYGLDENYHSILEVLSIDLVHLLSFNKTEWKETEDQPLVSWFNKNTNITLNRVGENCLIFTDPRIKSTYMKSTWKPWVSPNSVAINWLKDIHAWKGVVDLYFPDKI
jgi:hypothetical protein